MSFLLSATLPCTPRSLLGTGEFSPVPQLLPIARPWHWLDLARPIYRLMAHPLTMALGWGVVFLLASFSFWAALMVALL